MEDFAAESTMSLVKRDVSHIPPLVAQKLAAFEQLAPDVLTSFPYIEDVHGQRRFPQFPIEATIRYLHALWVCDCKDMLLGVPTASGRRRRGTDGRFERHEGQRALEVLCDWQQGRTAEAIAFLEFKLEYAPVYEITRSFEAAHERGDRALARRLAHGRMVLLNRTHNLTRALSAIFALPSDRLLRGVREACARYGHTIEQCTAQLSEMGQPLYSLVRHPALARRNMLLMNSLGIGITDNQSDRPGRRTPTVQRPVMPHHAYAEHVVADEITMLDLGPLQL